MCVDVACYALESSLNKHINMNFRSRENSVHLHACSPF